MVLSYCQTSTAGSACPVMGRATRLIHADHTHTMTTRDYAWRVCTRVWHGSVRCLRRSSAVSARFYRYSFSRLASSAGSSTFCETSGRHAYKLEKDSGHLLRVHRTTQCCRDPDSNGLAQSSRALILTLNAGECPSERVEEVVIVGQRVHTFPLRLQSRNQCIELRRAGLGTE
jgi:hypothetical protein